MAGPRSQPRPQGDLTLNAYANTLLEPYLALSRIIDAQTDDLFESGCLDPK
jgi:hypothetical protein